MLGQTPRTPRTAKDQKLGIGFKIPAFVSAFLGELGVLAVKIDLNFHFC
jgi:hypothetical protein